ncbi:MAG: alpha/beta hydrolase, partial [Cyanobacteria bacterium P01_F01_bin.42]
HQQALAWLNQTFDPPGNDLEVNQPDFRDRRMGWYGLHLLGWLILTAAVLPLAATAPAPTESIGAWRAWGGLVLAPFVSLAAIKLLNTAVPAENLGRLMIGGALGFWLLITGAVWLSVIGKLPRPRRQDLLIGLLGFACLWAGFGAMAQVVWLPWLLTGQRLLLWALIAIACIPWFLASNMMPVATWRSRLVWWLGQTVAIVGGLILAMVAVPNLGFLAIMLPAFPVLLAVFLTLSRQARSVWGSALACAATLSWLIVVPFPVL